MQAAQSDPCTICFDFSSSVVDDDNENRKKPEESVFTLKINITENSGWNSKSSLNADARCHDVNYTLTAIISMRKNRFRAFINIYYFAPECLPRKVLNTMLQVIIFKDIYICKP